MRNAVCRTAMAGFTLIELMIVVAVIGILASIAIPAYQDYVARAQISEAMQLLGGVKTPLAEYFADTGSFPVDLAEVVPNRSGAYVADINYVAAPTPMNGEVVIQARMHSSNVNSLVAGRTLLLETSDGGRSWTCRSDTLDPRVLPRACE